MLLIDPNTLAIGRKDGVFSPDMSNGSIIDTLLYGENIGSMCRMRDQSLWLGTQGNGVFRFVNSPVKTIKIPVDQPSVQYVTSINNNIYATLKNHKDAVIHMDTVASSVEMSGYNSAGDVVNTFYLGKTAAGDWLRCAADLSISKNWIIRYPAGLFSTSVKRVS